MNISNPFFFFFFNGSMSCMKSTISFLNHFGKSFCFRVQRTVVVLTIVSESMNEFTLQFNLDPLKVEFDFFCLFFHSCCPIYRILTFKGLTLFILSILLTFLKQPRKEGSSSSLFDLDVLNLQIHPSLCIAWWKADLKCFHNETYM